MGYLLYAHAIAAPLTYHRRRAPAPRDRVAGEEERINQAPYNSRIPQTKNVIHTSLPHAMT